MSKKALLFIENLFDEAETLYPYYRLQEAGYTVDIVGPIKGNTYKGKYGYPLTASVEAVDVNIADYACTIIPGGYAPDKMRVCDSMVELLKEAYKKGLVIGAICHGPQMLIEADIVRGRNVTCHKSVLTDVLNAGAIYHDLEVIIDDRLVTSRTPRDLPAFCHEIMKLLGEK